MVRPLRTAPVLLALMVALGGLGLTSSPTLAEDAWLGVVLQPVDQDLREALDLESGRGVLVAEVMEDSPAESAGIEEGDVIIKVGDRTAKSVLERNVVVEVGAPARGRRRPSGILAARSAVSAATRVAAAVEHCQFTPEALQDDLRGVAVLTLLVGPFAGLELALHIDLRSLAKKPLNDIDEAVVEDHDPVPFGAFATLTRRLVAPRLGGGEGEIGDARPVLKRTDLRITSQIADEDDLVHATRHDASPFYLFAWIRRSMPSRHSMPWSIGVQDILIGMICPQEPLSTRDFGGGNSRSLSPY